MLEARLLLQHLVHAVLQTRDIDVELFEHLQGEPPVQLGEGEKHVGDAPLAVAPRAHGLLRGGEHLLGLLGESVLSHHGVTPLPRVRGVFRGGRNRSG